MRSSVKFVVVACCIAGLAASAAAQGVPKTVVTGAPPFTLGMPTGDALAANRALSPTSAPCPTAGGTVKAVPTVNYETRMVAPLGGYPYLAHVVLCFYQGKLSVIQLEWPKDAFRDSPIEWRSRALGLARQLNSAYAANLITRNHVDEDIGGRVEIRDAQGNVLTMVADGNSGGDAGGLDIMLHYVDATFAQALNGPAKLEGSY